jgi:TRAP-type mannitol/chloroaromatic compound transport system permease small subunit
MKRLLSLFLSTAFFLLPFLSNAQCAMCRAVLKNADQGVTAAAINDGITFLVIWPYLLVGFAFFMVWRMMRSVKKKGAEE